MPRVMVIDDCQMMRTYLRRSLEQGGFEVEDWQPSGAGEVLDRLRASPPDLLVTDFAMAACNGATVLRMARKADPRLPAIVLTAFLDAALEDSLLGLGARRVYAKPIAPRSLVQAVRETLREAREG